VALMLVAAVWLTWVPSWLLGGQRPPAAVPDAPPLVGEWQLNLALTHYGPGVDRRRSERMSCAMAGRELRCRIHSVRSDGRELTGTFTAVPDGPGGPTTGIPDIDEVRLQKPGATTIDATFLFRGKAVYGYRVFQSDDGRSLMIVSVYPGTGEIATTIVVYDRKVSIKRAAQ
jgi:hypothetical protein